MTTALAASSVEGTYTAIAARVGVSTGHVSLILNRKRTPSLPVARKLAKAMGVSLDELARMLLDKRRIAA